MKIAVIGAGAIGGLVAGYLKQKSNDVTLVAHADSVAAIQRDGLCISGVRKDLNVRIDVVSELTFSPDLTIVATKSQDLDAFMRLNAERIKTGFVLTTQNGVRADEIVARYVPSCNIISSIVMFGATHLEPGKITHNFEGSWIIGKPFSANDAAVTEIAARLNALFPTIVTDSIGGMKYLKVFVNANNCIPGILGVSMQEAFADVKISAISIALWKEGLAVVNASGIRLASLPDFPLDRLMKLTGMPLIEAAKVFSGIMTNLSKVPLYGSILQSIKRGKPSEIDFINGEFVQLAKAHQTSAALNEKIVSMVHEVERTKKFFTKEEFIKSVSTLVPEGVLH